MFPRQEPLNSGDDVSDEEDQELFDTENVVVCQYDKVRDNLFCERKTKLRQPACINTAKFVYFLLVVSFQLTNSLLHRSPVNCRTNTYIGRSK